MARDIKHRIKYRSEYLEDIDDLAIQAIDYSVDGKETVSIQRDAWELLEVADAIMHRLLPYGREHWEVKRIYDDPEWDGEIIVYAD